MTTVRQSMEQAVLVSIGAAALTRERAEAAVNDLVRKGQMGSGSKAGCRGCSASWAW
jgi:polyhydroxyalkanoate synthesis regulator phasin